MTSNKRIETLGNFAKLQADIVKSDRWSLIAVSGEMGEGKSCFVDQLLTACSKETKTKFTLNGNMTYKREELNDYIDSKNQLPEHSGINADELISMFFKRNWYDRNQINGVELLNKCRDRHLIVAGCIPNFWDLDSAVLSVIRFWVHIHERGRAWVFQKSRNPFASDKWYKKDNEKKFKKHKIPYDCEGFLFEIHFPDWTPKRKKDYYSIRNVKRKNTEGQTVKEKFSGLKGQRNILLRLLYTEGTKIKTSELATLLGMSIRMVQYIKEGVV